MGKLFDGIVIFTFMYVLAKLDLKNEKMQLMETSNTTSFKEYSLNYKHLIKKHHPDFNENASLEAMESIQTIHDKFYKSENAFRKYFLELFIIGDLDEDDVSKIKSIFKFLTKILIANSLSSVFIFFKVTGGKRIIFSFSLLIFFITIHCLLIFAYYLYLFENKFEFLMLIRQFVSHSSFHNFFQFATIHEIVHLGVFIQLVFFYLYSLLMNRTNKIQNNYVKLFAELVKKLQKGNFSTEKKTDEQRQILSEIVGEINQIQGKENKIWKGVQSVLTVIILLLALKQGI